jgi:iron complex transport system ATP-binding protein
MSPRPPGGTPLLRVCGLQLRRGNRTLCRNLDLSLQPGQCWGLLGRNGAGKSTLLHTLAGLFPPNRGRVLLHGRDITTWHRRQIAQRVGLLLQQREQRFPATALQQVLAGRYPHLGPWRGPGQADWERADAVLNEMDIAGLAERNVQSLSGGEAQRVAVATVLAQDPPVMLMDEPASHLDLREQIRVLRLLAGRAGSGHLVIMSLHDLNHALTYCDHLLLLHQGRLIAGPTERIGRERLLARVFRHPLATLVGPHGPVMVPR